jgi:hypothetical protein
MVRLRSRLASDTAPRVTAIITRALHDPEQIVRVGTIHALGQFGGADMIPELQRVAEEDSAYAVGSTTKVFGMHSNAVRATFN